MNPGTTTLERARDYVLKGYAPIPIPHREKNPGVDKWQDLRLQEADLPQHFNGQPLNIGVLLGAPSGDLVDIDLDAAEAVALADQFLPKTGSEFGRPSKPRSHRLYVATIGTEKFADLDKGEDHTASIVEIRSTGGQTVFPGSTHPSGEAVEWAQDGPPAAVEAAELRRGVVRLACAAMLARHWPGPGVRHEAALAAAGLLARADLDEADVVKIVMSAAKAAGDAEWQDRKRAALDTVAQIAAGAPATGGPTLADVLRGDGSKVVKVLRRWLGVDARGEGFTLTDAGNAQRFARDHGDDVRYCWAHGTWLEYDGRRWCRDAGAGVMQRAKQTARGIYAEAARATDADVRKRLAVWAAKSESEPGLRRLLLLAQSEPELIIRPEQLDADVFVLNTPSGTVQLRTSHLRPPRREDYITRMTAAPYVTGARHRVWETFLDTVVPDEDTRDYLQRFAGYCLTADTSEEKFGCGHGPTAGGKTTFAMALRNAMGDYAGVADVTTFCDVDRSDRAPREDIARLEGLRLAVAAEVEAGSSLAAGLVKALFGGDAIVARHLYQSSREFRPAFKLLLMANHRLRAPDDDEALWRRVVEIPFTVSIPAADRDPAIKATLTNPAEAGPAVLAWAVEGAAKWFAQGLRPPQAVEDATASYRASQDPLRDFLLEACALDPSGEILAGELRTVYDAWTREQGIRHPLGGRAFGTRLRARGCSDFRRAGARWWRGLRARGPEDDAAPTLGRDSNDGIDSTSDNSSRARAQEGSSGFSRQFRHSVKPRDRDHNSALLLRGRMIPRTSEGIFVPFGKDARFPCPRSPSALPEKSGVMAETPQGRASCDP